VQIGVSDELKRKIDRDRCSEERESRGQREVLLFVGGDLCFHSDRFSFKLSGEAGNIKLSQTNSVSYALNHMT
jgi:hypothetical protein